MPLCLPRIVSTIGSVNSWVCLNLVLSTRDYVHEGLFLFEIMYTWQSVQLGVCLLGFFPLWSLATWHSLHLDLCPLLVLSTSGFCSSLNLSTCDSVQLGVCLLGFCPLWSLSTWHSAHVVLCSLLVLSTLVYTHVWFFLLGIMFIKDFFYLRSCPLAILFTRVFAYLDSALSGAWARDILPM